MTSNPPNNSFSSGYSGASGSISEGNAGFSSSLTKEAEMATPVKGNLNVPIPHGATPSTTRGLLHTANVASEPAKPGIGECLATFFSILLFIITFPITIFCSVKVVNDYERAVVLRLGRLRKGGARGPGTFFILPCIDEYKCIDIRTVSFDVPSQHALTRDNLVVAVDAVVYYRVFNPVIAVLNVASYSSCTAQLATTTLRNVIGTKTLNDLLSDRVNMANTLQEILDDATDPWGVKVERVEIKTIEMAPQIQRVMQSEAEALRQAQAKIIAAQGELESSKALKEASEVMEKSKAALQLRYLQTLAHIGTANQTTVFFPLPVNVISPFVQR